MNLRVADPVWLRAAKHIDRWKALEEACGDRQAGSRTIFSLVCKNI